MSVIEVGRGGLQDTTAIFEYNGQTLKVYTGIDQISWGYTLNTANFPTYGGEVVQILSCFVEDMNLQGTVRNYEDMQKVYDFFLRFINDGGNGPKNAAGLVERNETPIKFTYGPRRWVFDIYVKELPGYRQGRDVVAPTWQIKAHVINHAGDVDELSELIISEARYKDIVGDDEFFGTNGRMFFIDENPFSDPYTKHGKDSKDGKKFDQFERVSDYYTKLLPSYLNGDLDILFSQIGSKPSFDPTFGIRGNEDDSAAEHEGAVKEAAKRGGKGG